jgi:GR25 family glycosyltransferase involved in LPS biosynthesis
MTALPLLRATPSSMKCIYVNLDRDEQRREAMESQFGRFHPPGWTLERFSAVDGQEVARRGIEGRLTPGEMGCFLSHRDIVSKACGESGHLMIVEDDAVFDETSFRLIEQAVADREQADGPWDLLFTDVCITSIANMVGLYGAKLQNYANDQQIRYIDVSVLSAAGSSAYVINAASKPKLLEMLNRAVRLDRAYDLYLQALIRDGQLSATVAFPFLTTVGLTPSTIQPTVKEEVNRIWDSFRRQIWVGAANTPDEAVFHELDAALDSGARNFGTLFAAGANTMARRYAAREERRRKERSDNP